MDTTSETRDPPAAVPSPQPSVVRLCSVFEVPSGAALDPRFDPVGGMQNHTGQLTRALDRIGVAQHVVTAWRPGCPRVQRIGDCTTVQRVGAPTARLRQLYALPAWRALRGRARDADLVHAHLGEDLAVVPLGLLTARHVGRPLVLTVHCSLRHTLKVTNARSAVLRGLGGRLEHLGVGRASAIITLTQRLADLLVAGGVPGERIHVIPSGVDPARFVGPQADPTPTIGPRRALFIGRLAPQKDVRTLIDAVPHLRRDTHVVLVGDGSQRAALERRVAELGIGQRVTFAGFVPPALVPSHLAHADVLVLPSAYEELGSVLLEGMQAGLPIVASAVGGIPEVVIDGVNGLLAAPGDPVALAGCINAVLADPALAARLRAGSCDHARRFHWDVLARRVVDVYRSVAAAPSRTRS